MKTPYIEDISHINLCLQHKVCGLRKGMVIKMRRKKMNSVLALGLAGIMTLTGCGSSAETKSESTDTAASAATEQTQEENVAEDEIDLSQEVNLVGYLLGEAPEGMPQVLEAVNEKLKDELNTTIEIRYLGWGEYTTKYPLLLAAGEDIDFIFTADWCMYTQEATKNAFYEITEEDMQKYMPLHYQNCDHVAFWQSQVNGKNYMITTSTPDRRCDVVAYRKDLADKYNVGELNKLGDFTKYFAAIAENESDIQPMNLDSTYDLKAPFMALRKECSDGWEDANNLGLFWCFEDEDVTMTPMYEGEIGEATKYAANIMKEWYDAGYVNKDVFSNTIRSTDAFLEGKSAVAFGNSVDMQSFLASAKDKGYDVGIVPVTNQNGHTLATSYLNNGVAIAATCQYPERTMMVLDKLMEDETYNYLVYFGIEGENYIITEDNKIGLPEGVTNDTNTYPADAAGFWFTNKDQHLPMASWSDDYVALKEQIEGGMLVNHAFASFAPNLEDIQTETANITQVLQQYFNPMCVGMVDNVDNAISTLEEKMKASGIEDVRQEIQSQADTYMGK